MMFVASMYAVSAGVTLSALLVAACVTDVKARRIPNALVAVTAVLGILYSVSAEPR